MEIKINSKKIGLKNPTYFIADVAANHDGDLERAKDLIYKAAEVGADAAKFQHFKANTIVSDFGFKSMGGQQSHQSKWKKSVYEVYEDASLKDFWTPILKKTCDKAGIAFLTSPYSYELVDSVDKFISAYKIGSGDITWTDLIKYMSTKGKPLLLATGASTFDEVCNAVQAVLSVTKGLVLMQCNTNYTASLENFKYINLNVLKTFSSMYPDLILGLSDHTPGNVTVLGAVTLGARVIEKHFTDNLDREGPDHKFSMNPKTWKEMVDRTRELELALGLGIKRVEDNEKETVIIQRRSIRVKKDLMKDTVLNIDNLEVLRPSTLDGLPPSQIENVIGKSINKDLKAGDYIRWTDLEIAVIIPAWNEEKTIGRVVETVLPFAQVIVVNDKSIDSTEKMVLSAGAILVNHITNKGYGEALNSGFKKAMEMNFNYAITFDADGQHDSELITKYYELLKSGFDLVLGVRPKTARLSEYIFAKTAKLLFGISDPLCGMKGYNMKLYKEHGSFDSCNSIGTELAIWSVYKKFNYTRVSIPIHSRLDSPRFGRIIKANIKIFFALIRVLKKIYFTGKTL